MPENRVVELTHKLTCKRVKENASAASHQKIVWRVRRTLCRWRTERPPAEAERPKHLEAVLVLFTEQDVRRHRRREDADRIALSQRARLQGLHFGPVTLRTRHSGRHRRDGAIQPGGASGQTSSGATGAG